MKAWLAQASDADSSVRGPDAARGLASGSKEPAQDAGQKAQAGAEEQAQEEARRKKSAFEEEEEEAEDREEELTEEQMRRRRA